MRENRSQFAILGALTIAPMSGYDLKQFADQSVRHFWSESFGQIYPMLRRLETDGFVERQPSSATTRRERIVYAITDSGRGLLAKWLAEPAGFDVGRVEVLLKLFFARNAPAGTATRLLRAFRAEHVARLERYGERERMLREERGGYPDLPYWLATLSYGRYSSTALVAWCDESLALFTDSA